MNTCKECGKFATYRIPEDIFEDAPETFWCRKHSFGKTQLEPLMYSKPVHKHDCDHCIYLGTLKPRTVDCKPTKEEPFIDCYWCPSVDYPPLSSMIARYGSVDSHYASYHPRQDEVLLMMDRAYMFILLQATLRGLWGKTREQIRAEALA